MRVREVFTCGWNSISLPRPFLRNTFHYWMSSDVKLLLSYNPIWFHPPRFLCANHQWRKVFIAHPSLKMRNMNSLDNIQLPNSHYYRLHQSPCLNASESQEYWNKMEHALNSCYIDWLWCLRINVSCEISLWNLIRRPSSSSSTSSSFSSLSFFYYSIWPIHDDTILANSFYEARVFAVDFTLE